MPGSKTNTFADWLVTEWRCRTIYVRVIFFHPVYTICSLRYRIQGCRVDQISATPTLTPTPAWKNRLRLQLRIRPTSVSFFHMSKGNVFKNSDTSFAMLLRQNIVGKIDNKLFVVYYLFICICISAKLLLCPGFFLMSAGRWSSDNVMPYFASTDSRKGSCWTKVRDSRCEANLPGAILKSECCCSVGLAWGSPCEICSPDECPCDTGYAKVTVFCCSTSTVLCLLT